jgi:hypothetical protein
MHSENWNISLETFQVSTGAYNDLGTLPGVWGCRVEKVTESNADEES